MKTKNKKIAFVTPIYLPANLFGSGVVVRQIAEAFAKNGADVSVITSNALVGRYWYDSIFGKKIKNRFEVVNGVKIYRLSCNQIISSFCFVLVRYCNFLLPPKILNKLQIIYNGPYLIGLNNILNKEQFDIIHCSPFPLNINRQIVEAVNKLKKKPKLIITPFFHSQVPEFKNQELQDILSNVDVIHLISNAEKDDINKLFKINQGKIKIAPLFIDTKKLFELENTHDEIKEFKEKHQLDKRKIILFAGNKGTMKGAIHLLLAVNKLYKKNQSYVLIAVGNKTSAWEKAKKVIDKKCLLDFAYKQGKEKEIIFGACDIFCMPSISESFGLVYLEAWHKKKPVIGANIPAVKELIDGAKGGLLVEYGNEEELQGAIEKLASDRLLAKQLGENGYQALISKYDFSKIFEKYVDLFNLD